MPTHSKLLVLLLLILLSGTTRLHAQGDGPHLGKVYMEDFDIRSPLIGPTTDAVIIADTGMTKMEAYSQGWRLSYHRLKRVKVLNANGVKALSKLKLTFSAAYNGDGRLGDLKATTYNLRDGKLYSTSLSSKDVYVAKAGSGDKVRENVAFPDVQVGSIIEYSYSYKSGSVGSLIPWDFQSEYPCLWSQYAIVFPDIFNYLTITGTSLSFDEMTTESVKKEIWMGGGNVDANVWTKKWVIKNVPPFKEEPFVSCMDDHIARIGFQISTFPSRYFFSFSPFANWVSASNQLLDMPMFGTFRVADPVIKKHLDSLITDTSSKMVQARRVYAYVRDKFKSEEYTFFLTAPFEETLRKKEGTTGDLNLLLTCMLRHRGILADPVIVSTRGNGVTDVHYPLLDKFNYVIVRMKLDSQVYYLDASVKNLAFGRLPPYCYNGHARVISKSNEPVFFSPDSLHEDKITRVSIRKEGDAFTARFVDTLGFGESIDTRRTLKDKRQDEFFKDLGISFSRPSALSSYSIDSLDNYEQPVVLHYSTRLDPDENADLLYFNPMMTTGVKKNPYPPATRSLPVELPYVSSISYTMDLEVPKGYVVEELPASDTLVLKAPDHSEEARCEYRLTRSGDHIWLQYKMQMEKTSLPPDRYQSLRAFIDDVLKKEHAMIVLRRTDKAAGH